MRGPQIIANTIAAAKIAGKYGNTWQYHSRSDHHFKVACLAILLDLLSNSEALRRHATNRHVFFGINHEMRDFKTGRKKNLDLVISTRGAGEGNNQRTLGQLVRDYGLVLGPEDQAEVSDLPVLREGPVGAVQLALEAKACMTAHQKARPRLYDELSSSHLTIHGASDVAIAVGFAMVNASTEFRSPDMNKFDLTRFPERRNNHRQPRDAAMTIEKLHELPRRTQRGEEGFDAFGLIVVDMANDGGPVRLIDRPPAPPAGDIYNYDSMIHRVVQLYQDRYP